jgi:hypothetical protein
MCAGSDQLEFGVDLNAAEYVNGVRRTPNGEVLHHPWTLRRGFTWGILTPSYNLNSQGFSTVPKILWALKAAVEREGKGRSVGEGGGGDVWI